jgi:hypothetical protein
LTAHKMTSISHRQQRLLRLLHFLHVRCVPFTTCIPIQIQQMDRYSTLKLTYAFEPKDLLSAIAVDRLFRTSLTLCTRQSTTRHSLAPSDSKTMGSTGTLLATSPSLCSKAAETAAQSRDVEQELLLYSRPRGPYQAISLDLV